MAEAGEDFALSDMADARLKPYLAGSFILHIVLILFVVFAAPRASSAPNQIYRIQLIGAEAGIINRSTKMGAAPSTPRPLPKPRQMLDPDAFDTRKRANLPKPSVLDESASTAKETKPAASGADGAPAESGADVAPEMDNFPYPWYITQVRSAIWQRWSSRMPSAGECGVVFTIMKNGSVVDLRVEFTSGDKSFDYAALSSVRDSAPFGPLPPAFSESFLKIHVQLRASGK